MCILGIHVIGDNGHARQVNSGKALSSCSDVDGSFSLYMEQDFSGAGDADSRDELTKKAGVLVRGAWEPTDETGKSCYFAAVADSR